MHVPSGAACRIATLLLSSAALFGCPESGGSLGESRIIDRFVQAPPEQADILLVVDDTAAMTDEQERLGATFDNLTLPLNELGVDWRIAVTSMDVGLGGEQGRFVGEPPVLTQSTPDAAGRFTARVRLGSDGGGPNAESGFEAVRFALRPELLDGLNAGFYREEAVLEILFLSNEEDHSPGSVTDFVSFLYGFKGERDRDRVRASAVAGIDPVADEAAFCDWDPVNAPYDGATDAPRYLEAARRTGGIVGSACDEDYGPVIDELAETMLRKRNRFRLSARPDLSDFTVRVLPPDDPAMPAGGWEVPTAGLPDGRFAWFLDDDGIDTWLVFSEAPEWRARIEVEYRTR